MFRFFGFLAASLASSVVLAWGSPYSSSWDFRELDRKLSSARFDFDQKMRWKKMENDRRLQQIEDEIEDQKRKARRRSLYRSFGIREPMLGTMVGY